MPHFLKLLVSCALIHVVSGCTAVQLQKSSNNQAKTLSAIYEQQVLDNLAVFATDASATPFFAVPADGLNQVSDNASMGAGEGFLTGKFWSHIGAGAARTKNQSWGLIPVAEPLRLKLMQCAYRKAIGAGDDLCNDCCELEKAWEGPDYQCGGPCDITCGWVKCSTNWKDVPKCCCEHYGKHCGVFVWVDPCHKQEFSKLVFKIVEYASGKPYSAPTKEVRFYLNSDGTAGTVSNHAKVVIAQVDADETQASLEKKLNVYDINYALEQLKAMKKTASALSDSAAQSYLKGAVPRSLVPATEVEDATPKVLLDKIEMEIERLERAKSEFGPVTPMRNAKDFGDPAQSRGLFAPQLNLELNRIRSGQ